MRARQAKKVITQHWRWNHYRKSTLLKAAVRYFKGPISRDYAFEIIGYSYSSNWELAS